MQKRHRKIGRESRGDDFQNARQRHVNLDVAAVREQHCLEYRRERHDDERLAHDERYRHAPSNRAHVELAHFPVAIAEHLHIADGARAVIDDRLREQIHEYEEDEHRHAHEHSNHVVHHARELLANGIHIGRRKVARHITGIERERLVGNVPIEVGRIVAEHRVEIVQAHVDIHGRLRAPRAIVARERERMRLVFVLVVQLDCIALLEAELVNQAAAEDRLAVSKVHIGPITRILLHAIHGNRFLAIALAAIVLQ